MTGAVGEGPAGEGPKAKGFRLSAAWERWGALSPIWQRAVWLALFLLASRLLYLSWSQTVAGSEHGELAAPRGTTLVLKGPRLRRRQRADAAVRALRKRDAGERAGRGRAASRPLLVEMGAVLPPADRAPGTLSWNVNTRGGTLRLSSSQVFELSPVVQDSTTISGWLLLGGQPTGVPPDVAPTFLVAPEKGEAAEVTIGYRSVDPELVLGDPFAAESSIALRSVALLDEGGGLVRRICGAPGGRMMLLPALFQPRLEPQPPGDRCRAGYLTASAARLQEGEVGISLSGSGFVAGTADWLDKLKGSIVLWPVILALIAIPGQRLLKLAPVLLSRKPA